MLGRATTTLAESSQKLEEIERQLKVHLLRAKEVASACCSDEGNMKTQEQQMSELQVQNNLVQQLQLPVFDARINYDHEYWKTYLQNEINLSLIRQATEKKNQLNELLIRIEVIND